MTQVERIIQLLRHSESLKDVERTGWALSGVESERIESVAEHSYGSVLSSIIFVKHLKSKGIDVNMEKVVVMAALHDLPESITGDIARTETFVKDKELVKAKEFSEMKAIKGMFEPLGEAFGILEDIWNEFNLGESMESRVVKGADIIDMIMHARYLEESGTSPESLHQFFKSSQTAINAIDIEIVTEIYNTLRHEHEQKAREQNINLDKN